MLSLARYELSQPASDCIEDELCSSRGYVMTPEWKHEGYVSRVFNYIENGNSYEKYIEHEMLILFLFTTSVRNIFHSNKYCAI